MGSPPLTFRESFNAQALLLPVRGLSWHSCLAGKVRMSDPLTLGSWYPHQSVPEVDRETGRISHMGQSSKEVLEKED